MSREHLIRVLLQEQDQYRQEIRMFDSHLFRVMVTYVTGLVAAFGWLGSQVITRSASFKEIVGVPSDSVSVGASGLGSLTSLVLVGLAEGPFFYFFAAIPVITALMFLFVARDWSSLHERFALVKPVSEKLQELVDPNQVSGLEILSLDRGLDGDEKTLRQYVEMSLVVLWALAVTVVSGFIMWRILPYTQGVTGRWIWWAVGTSIIPLTVVTLLLILGMHRKRAYQSAKLGTEKEE